MWRSQQRLSLLRVSGRMNRRAVLFIHASMSEAAPLLAAVQIVSMRHSPSGFRAAAMLTLTLFGLSGLIAGGTFSLRGPTMVYYIGIVGLIRQGRVAADPTQRITAGKEP